ncbi:MAG: hypothetical protein HZA64_08530 [Rhodocyclales bacterium]|jgi:hypothetical protein|nr:hypothetical protein [Rhodocyclales bacterium]
MIASQINKASSHTGHGAGHGSRGWFAGAMLVTSGSLSASVPPEEPSCTQIRAAIGVLQPANPELLRSLAARKDCGFTSAEVYQAAYGDRPLPPQDGRAEYPKRYHHLGDAHFKDD